MLKTSDSCSGLPDPERIYFEQEVDKDDNDVTLDQIGGTNYIGSYLTHYGYMIHDDEFSVQADLEDYYGDGCWLVDEFVYFDIGDDRADVRRTLSKWCFDDLMCMAVYEGAASRS